MERYSYTGLYIKKHCVKLFQHYKQTHEAFLISDALGWGRTQHEKLQDRIVLEKPANEIEKQILSMASDWLYEYDVERSWSTDVILHGVLDLYSPSKNVAIEYKTGLYDPVQLDLYAWLIQGDVWLYTPQSFIKHEFDQARLEKFISDALNQSHTTVNKLCAQCNLAHVCEELNKKVQEGDIDARLLLAENYKQRARLLEDIEVEEDTETQYYKIKLTPTILYKLKRGLDRQELVKQIISDGKIHLLEFTPAKLKDDYPELVQEELRKTKKIEKKE